MSPSDGTNSQWAEGSFKGQGSCSAHKVGLCAAPLTYSNSLAPPCSHMGLEPPLLPRTMFLCGGWNLLSSLLCLISWVCSLHSCRALLSLEKKHDHIKVTSYKLIQVELAKSAVISVSLSLLLSLHSERLVAFSSPPLSFSWASSKTL